MAGIVGLVALGSQDRTINDKGNKAFQFKKIENTSTNPNISAVFDITKHGNIVQECYLIIEGKIVCIKKISLIIGGQIIVSHDGDYLHIYNNLSKKKPIKKLAKNIIKE